MSTITQSDPLVPLQATVKKSLRTHLNLVAIREGKKIGDVLTEVFQEYGGYTEPRSGGSAVSDNPRPSARPSTKQR